MITAKKGYITTHEKIPMPHTLKKGSLFSGLSAQNNDCAGFCLEAHMPARHGGV